MKGALAENASPESRLDPAFPLCCWIILTAAALVSIYAALEYRVLYADGAYYVQRILEEEGFAFIEPSRHYSQLLQKFPTVIAIWLGVDNIPALIICYGLTTYLLPLLLVSLCYFVLPPSRKVFFVFPLVHYLAGTTSASFVGIVEGPVAAAYFWLLLYLLLFRFERKAAMVLTLLALPAVLLHEAMVFLSPLLAAVAVWRARQERHKGGVPLFTLLAMWFMIVAVVQTYFILYPRDPGNRSHFIQDLVHLKWLFTTSAQVNVPALVGLLAMVVFTGVILAGRSLRGTKPAKNQWTLVVGFAMVSLPDGCGRNRLGKIHFTRNAILCAQSCGNDLVPPRALGDTILTGPPGADLPSDQSTGDQCHLHPGGDRLAVARGGNTPLVCISSRFPIDSGG